MTGVIFDFNGTMFDDSSKQRQVWLAYAEESFHRTISEEGYVRFTEDTIRLLDRLKRKGIPLAIATASPKSNVDWYWERFCLEKWFEMDNIDRQF